MSRPEPGEHVHFGINLLSQVVGARDLEQEICICCGSVGGHVEEKILCVLRGVHLSTHSLESFWSEGGNWW